MRILLLGAGGFIGRHVLAELIRHDHETVAIVRRSGNLGLAFPRARFVPMDLVSAIRSADWTDVLADVDIVVNAAGLLKGKAMHAVHVDMPRAMLAAAAGAGVRRIVLVSAISARADVATDYASTKLEGEEVLRNSTLGWTILRPSLLYGDGSYGGTSLIRGMAALPWLTPIPGRGDYPFTPIHVRDLARTVRLVCEDESFAGQTLEPVGPETLDLNTLISRYRAWLGFGETRFLSVPMPVMRLLARMGDHLGDGPIATNSLVQLTAGNAGDSAAFASAVGFSPRAIDAAFGERPAQVQDRWHARLFFLAPAVRAVLVFLWIASAALGLAAGSARTIELLSALGWPAKLADPLRIGGSVLDLLIAAFVLVDRTGRRSTPAQFVVVLGYSLVIGIALPRLWLDPLGPLLKNLPILVLILIYGAIGDKR